MDSSLSLSPYSKRNNLLFAFPSLFDEIRGNSLNLFPYYLSNTFFTYFTNRLVDKDSLSTKRLICPLVGQAKTTRSPPQFILVSLLFLYSFSVFLPTSSRFILFVLTRSKSCVHSSAGRKNWNNAEAVIGSCLSTN